MAKHHSKRSERSGVRVGQNPLQTTQDRSFDTENQMRDPLGIARPTLGRRFDNRYLAERLGSLRALRNLEVEDLRRNRYENSQLATKTYRRVDGRPAQIRRQPVRLDQVQDWQKVQPVRDFFRDPKRVLVCIRRAIRRSVIFALQLSRKGKGGGKKFRKAKWTDSSYISCRRR